MAAGVTGMEVERWNRSLVETELNWMTLTGLLSGTTYEVRVVAVTDREHVTRSQTRGVMIGSIPGINGRRRKKTFICQNAIFVFSYFCNIIS